METDVYLSFCMIVQDEEDRIKSVLENIKDVADEIVIIDGGSEDNTVSIAKNYTDKVHYRKFDGNFDKQKNFANGKCTGRWIFDIDADELLSQRLKKELKQILQLNEEKEVIFIPRKNKVKGITKEHLEKWNWFMDEDGDINWPDWQPRLHKNTGLINWDGKVHERLTGFDKYGRLPSDKSEGLYLIHKKDIARQEGQNNLYDKIINS